MDAKNIIPQGERAKYYVRSEKWNFSFEDNVYYLEIIYGLFGQKIVIPKSDFLFLNGMHLFSFPTDDIVGPVKARLVMDIVDPDCPDDVRQEVDEQYIGFVISQPCPQFFKCRSVVAVKKSSTHVLKRATSARSMLCCATRTVCHLQPAMTNIYV